MKKLFLFLCFAALVSTSAAMAMPVSCPGSPPPALTVDTYPPAGPSSVVYSCNGVTFDLFEAVDAGTKLPVVMNLVTANFDPTLGYVYLNFNPNISALGGVEDVWFYFRYTGHVNGVDLAVGGSGSSITERVCATVIDRNSANNCTGGLSQQLAVLANSSGMSTTVGTFPDGRVVGTGYIYKDINVRNGELTTFTESFHATTPEPVSMVLLGSGLVGISLIRRGRKVGQTTKQQQ